MKPFERRFVKSFFFIDDVFFFGEQIFPKCQQLRVIVILYRPCYVPRADYELKGLT